MTDEENQLAPSDVDEQLPDLLQKSYPQSLYNLVTQSMKNAMDHVSPNQLTMDERDLEKKLKPSPTLNMLRFRLWDEYNRVVDGNKKRLKIEAICRGVCTPMFLINNVFRSTVATAWLIRPPMKYEQLAQEALFTGISQIRKILSFSLYDENDKPDVKIARLQLDIVKMLDHRIQGAPVQRIQQVNVNAEATMKQMKEIMETDSMEALERKLGKLRKEMGDDANALEEPITPTEAHDVEMELEEGDGKQF